MRRTLRRLRRPRRSDGHCVQSMERHPRKIRQRLLRIGCVGVVVVGAIVGPFIVSVPLRARALTLAFSRCGGGAFEWLGVRAGNAVVEEGVADGAGGESTRRE